MLERTRKIIVFWRKVIKEMAILRGKDRNAMTQFSDTFTRGTFREKFVRQRF